jgi:hypothetical protein
MVVEVVAVMQPNQAEVLADWTGANGGSGGGGQYEATAASGQEIHQALHHHKENAGSLGGGGAPGGSPSFGQGGGGGGANAAATNSGNGGNGEERLLFQAYPHPMLVVGVVVKLQGREPGRVELVAVATAGQKTTMVFLVLRILEEAAAVVVATRWHRRLWHCHPKIPCTSRNHSHAYLQRIGVLGCT